MGKLIMYTVSALMVMDLESIDKEIRLFNQIKKAYLKHLEIRKPQGKDLLMLQVDLEHVNTYLDQCKIRFDQLVDDVDFDLIQELIYG